MPLVRISIRKGRTANERRAIVEAVYNSLRETFNVPEDDLFMLVDEYEEDNFHYGRNFMGFSRSESLIMLQLTIANTRGVDMKRALYKAIVDKLEASPGVRRDDVLINLVEVFRENWSFGDGVAQYV